MSHALTSSGNKPLGIDFHLPVLLKHPRQYNLAKGLTLVAGITSLVGIALSAGALAGIGLAGKAIVSVGFASPLKALIASTITFLAFSVFVRGLSVRQAEDKKHEAEDKSRASELALNARVDALNKDLEAVKAKHIKDTEAAKAEFLKQKEEAETTHLAVIAKVKSSHEEERGTLDTRIVALQKELLVAKALLEKIHGFVIANNKHKDFKKNFNEIANLFPKGEQEQKAKGEKEPAKSESEVIPVTRSASQGSVSHTD